MQHYDPAALRRSTDQLSVLRSSGALFASALGQGGSSYASASTTAAKTDGFAGTGSTNLTTSWPHEVWCNTASPAPTPSAANIATHPQCKKNTDTSSDNLYPNITYTFRKTYNGPAAYFTLDASEYCTDVTLTSCITRAVALAANPAFEVSGVPYTVPSKYRWCSYYNPKSHTFGGCQGRRDLDHYIPNYLGGWVSTGAAGVQATATLTIAPTTAGQTLTGLTVGGVDIVGGNTYTSAFNGDQVSVATSICNHIIANSSSSGFTCARTGSNLLIQSMIIGEYVNGVLMNGRPVIATGPTDVAELFSLGEIRVTPTGATAGLQISSIVINGRELINANVTADGNQGNTAAMICDAINSGPNIGFYEARSDLQATIAADGIAFGVCNSSADAYVQVRRKDATTEDNGSPL
ncbi:MAG: hypothetical protein IPP41_03685 [Rhodocyclaceae bacterium]|nr:hypothetical protein [Rhodocyclaceae bacterium]